MVNYDFPSSLETYAHRIGRTGRIVEESGRGDHGDGWARQRPRGRVEYSRPLGARTETEIVMSRECEGPEAGIALRKTPLRGSDRPVPASLRRFASPPYQATRRALRRHFSGECPDNVRYQDENRGRFR